MDDIFAVMDKLLAILRALPADAYGLRDRVCVVLRGYIDDLAEGGDAR